ncbi:HNH endonuclease [Candidatus Palauibacter sp.]|uniref:HNH endonuclease n=1 Tax=Candidatus Palauibacter sp. TaxID=3101350 RepID=UPI003AF2751D
MSWRRPGGINHRRWRRIRRRVFDRDGWRCTGCGRAGRLEAHHVVPLHAGGAPYDMANIAAVCRACHIETHRRTPAPAETRWRSLVDALREAP